MSKSDFPPACPKCKASAGYRADGRGTRTCVNCGAVISQVAEIAAELEEAYKMLAEAVLADARARLIPFRGALFTVINADD